EAVVAEVVEPGVPRGLGEERRLVEPDEREAGGPERAADTVQQAQTERAGHGVASAAHATVAGPPRRCGPNADERRRARIDAPTSTGPRAGAYHPTGWAASSTSARPTRAALTARRWPRATRPGAAGEGRSARDRDDRHVPGLNGGDHRLAAPSARLEDEEVLVGKEGRLVDQAVARGGHLVDDLLAGDLVVHLRADRHR